MFVNFTHTNDNKCGIWYIRAELRPVKTMHLEEKVMKHKQTKYHCRNFFELGSDRTYPLVFLPLRYSKKLPEDKDEDKRIVDMFFHKNFKV